MRRWIPTLASFWLIKTYSFSEGRVRYARSQKRLPSIRGSGMSGQDLDDQYRVLHGAGLQVDLLHARAAAYQDIRIVMRVGLFHPHLCVGHEYLVGGRKWARKVANKLPAIDCVAIFGKTFWDVPVTKRSQTWATSDCLRRPGRPNRKRRFNRDLPRSSRPDPTRGPDIARR